MCHTSMSIVGVSRSHMHIECGLPIGISMTGMWRQRIDHGEVYININHEEKEFLGLMA